MHRISIRIGLILLVTTLFARAALCAAPPIDQLNFGDDRSEQDHALKSDHSQIIDGGLGDKARELLPLDPVSWEGGRVSFTMKVDPEKDNYFTARLWGSDRTTGDLILYCEGKQIGYRHLGDIDILDIANGAPGYAGRFFYRTTPLPREMTKGKSELNFEIRATGPIWGYGTNFQQYQKPMTQASRGIYRVYTHSDGFFAPPIEEKQGVAPKDPPVRQTPGPEVLEVLKNRVNGEIDGMLKNPKPLNQHQMWFLARAYHVVWCDAYHKEQVVSRVIDGLDHLFADYSANPKLAQAGPDIYNNDWFGLGPAGAAISLLAEPIKSHVDEPVAGAGVSRREAWANMLVASRDWHRATRRQYTNQTMITDTYGIYQCNRGVAAIDPSRAMPESDARHYLYEAAAIQPWLGSEVNGVPMKPLGDNYLQLTTKGLSKELGFVGYYGEVLDWMTGMYNATRPEPGQPGDEKLREQLIKAAHARAFFRYPGTDEDGNRAMIAETIVGWRDADHYPGDVIYTQRTTWDASAVEATAATLDPEMLGGVQQMFADNQFFESVQKQMKVTNLRATAALLEIPDDYELLSRQAPSAHRLPTSSGAGDVFFADEEDGVLAVRHGDELLYVSLYWRARNAINDLARVHYVTPTLDRIAVVREDTKFTPSGEFYTRPDWTNFGFGNGGLKYPGEFHSAFAGEKLPIAKIPQGVKFKPGDENVNAGRGEFYTLRYGPYLIGMNCTTDKTFSLDLPKGAKIERLGSDEQPKEVGTLRVQPHETVVFYCEG